MNKTTHRRVHGGPLGAAIAVLLTAVSANAFADRAAPDAFRMMAIENRAEGELVTAGHYEQAIQKITARASRRSEFDIQNNLCVAYAKTMALYKAVLACDAALEARRHKAMPAHLHSPVARQKMRDRAIALSNRGVLRYALGDPEGARQDFEAAMALDSGLDEPGENLLLLEAGSVARR